jgi:ABC-type dipeptide/oligopeptide/nickel transport system permease component
MSLRSKAVKTWRYILRRLALMVPQILAIVTVMFILVRVIPSDPAVLIAGPSATPTSLKIVRHELGEDRSFFTQYVLFLKGIAVGDLGRSWVSGNPVTTDLKQRFPATLELLTYSLILACILGITLGVFTAQPGSGFFHRIADRGAFIYGFLAGAMPEFWIGLMLIFIFYYKLRILPAPLGRLDPIIQPPPHVTGFYTIDSLIAGDWGALKSSIVHLIGPVLTLAFVVTGPILKMTRLTTAQVLESDYIRRARAVGLSHSIVLRGAVRNALPPVLTLVGILYGYLIGGAVLIESVFSWGGMGQYAVQSIVNSDFAPLQGFVIVVTLFSLVLYLIVDLFYMAIDPRIKL